MLKKYHILLFIFSLLVFYSKDTLGQAYELDFSDTTTFSTTCGKIVPSSWTVKSDSCNLYTPKLTPGISESGWIKYSVKINQSGNLSTNDNAYILHQLNNGTWVTDTMLIGDGLAAVFSLYDSIWMNPGDIFRIRISLETSSATEFWQIKNGDIKVFYDTTSQTLPVEFTSFSLEQSDQLITLKWQTASETNNNYFAIEKSFDALSFNQIGIEKGAGNSNYPINYTYTDYIYSKYPITYYRIKQIDFDGKYSYSNTICSYKSSYSEEGQSIVYRNNQLFLIINTASQTAVEIYIINSQSGQLIKSCKINTEKGENEIPISSLISDKGIFSITSKIENQYFSNLIPYIHE